MFRWIYTNYWSIGLAIIISMYLLKSSSTESCLWDYCTPRNAWCQPHFENPFAYQNVIPATLSTNFHVSFYRCASSSALIPIFKNFKSGPEVTWLKVEGASIIIGASSKSAGGVSVESVALYCTFSSSEFWEGILFWANCSAVWICSRFSSLCSTSSR